MRIFQNSFFFFSGVEVVDIAVEDTYGNVANVSMAASVTIQPSGTVPEGTILPDLENSPVQLTLNRGTARLPRLTLCSRVGNHIGEYMLVFSAPGVESHSVKFAFSTGKSINIFSSFWRKKRILSFPQRKAKIVTCGSENDSSLQQIFVETLS